MEKKARSRIPQGRASEALFLSDHTCCVCNERGKPVQIHHINENPADHRLENLAVLCLHDHDRTQTRGGFGRHLAASEVVLFRDSWLRVVAQRHTRSLEGTLASPVAVAAQPQLPTAMLGPFLNGLPAIKENVHRQAYPGWDSGVSAEMNNSTYDAIDALEAVWLVLSRWYPASHFDLIAADQYVREFIADRFLWHRAVYQPHGEGTAGTMLGQLVAGGVLRDLDQMISDTVEGLWFGHDPDSVDLPAWRLAWERAGAREG